MGIEFFTGFEGCGSTAEAKAMVTNPGGAMEYVASGGYKSSKGVRCSSATGPPIFTQTVLAAKTKVAGWHSRNMTVNAYDSNINRYGILRFNGPDLRFYNTSSGIAVYRVTTHLFTETGTTIGSGTHHIEVKVFADAVAGTVQVKVDGGIVIDRSDLNTGTADVTSVAFPMSNQSIYYIDNVFIADDWQGELESVLRLPNADDSVQFTRNAGDNNFSRINQTASDGDTTYNASGTVGHKDIFGYEDLDAGLVPVAVTFVTRASKDDTGERQLEQLAVQDAVEYTQGTKVLSTSYIPTSADELVKTLGACPDATAWTREKLNAIKWAYKVAA
jgi:hypothetical protein